MAPPGLGIREGVQGLRQRIDVTGRHHDPAPANALGHGAAVADHDRQSELQRLVEDEGVGLHGQRRKDGEVHILDQRAERITIIGARHVEAHGAREIPQPYLQGVVQALAEKLQPQPPGALASRRGANQQLDPLDPAQVAPVSDDHGRAFVPRSVRTRRLRFDSRTDAHGQDADTAEDFSREAPQGGDAAEMSGARDEYRARQREFLAQGGEPHRERESHLVRLHRMSLRNTGKAGLGSFGFLAEVEVPRHAKEECAGRPEVMQGANGRDTANRGAGDEVVGQVVPVVNVHEVRSEIVEQAVPGQAALGIVRVHDVVIPAAALEAMHSDSLTILLEDRRFVRRVA